MAYIVPSILILSVSDTRSLKQDIAEPNHNILLVRTAAIHPQAFLSQLKVRFSSPKSCRNSSTILLFYPSISEIDCCPDVGIAREICTTPLVHRHIHLQFEILSQVEQRISEKRDLDALHQICELNQCKPPIILLVEIL